MCEGCPLESLADFYPDASTELRIWHGKVGQPDRVTLTVTHRGEEFSVTDEHCRTAVAKMLEEMDGKRIGDCRVVMVD